MRHLTLFLLLLLSGNLAGQQWSNRNVDICVKSVELESLLQLLQVNHDLRFSYGFDNVTARLPITLQYKSVSLLIVINEVARQANLEYGVFQNAIVFKPKELPALNCHSPETLPWNVAKGLTACREVHKFECREPARVNKALLKTAGLTKVITDEVVSLTARTQPRRLRQPRIALSAHLLADINYYNFKELDGRCEYDIPTRNVGIGIGMSYRIAGELHLVAGVTSFDKSFRAYHNEAEPSGQDPVEIADHTQAYLQYIEVPVGLSFQLMKSQPASFWFVATLTNTRLIANEEITHYKNQKAEHSHQFTSTNARTLNSVAVGIIFNQSISEHSSLFIESSYIHYTRAINSHVMDSPGGAYRMKAGVLYRLIRKRR